MKRVMRRLRREVRWAVRVFVSPLVVVHEAFHPSIVRSFPMLRAPARRALVLAVSAVIAAIALLRWAGQWVLVVAVVVVASGGVVVRWGRRVARERKSGLPPGGPARGWSLIIDPDHYRDRWRRFGPVFKTGFVDRPEVCIVGLERAAALLADETSIGRGEMDYDRLVPGGIARRMSGDQARYYRPLLNGAFRPAMVQANEEVLVGHVERAVRDLAGGGGGPGGVDPLPIIQRMLTAAWLELFFGLAPADPVAVDVAGDLSLIVRYRHRAGPRSEEAVARIESAIRAHALGQAGSWARPNAMSTILDREPSAVDDSTMMRNLILLTETSRQDLGGLLMWLTKHLADNPGWQERVRSSVSVEARDSIAAAVVSETLRMEQSEYLSRVALADTEIEGHTIPAGYPVHVCVAESHRDPATFEGPEDYRPDRFIERRYGRSEYSPFGVNDRMCVGEQLSRFMARKWVLALCARHRVVVRSDGPRAYSAQRHWAPNPMFRIGVEVIA